MDTQEENQYVQWYDSKRSIFEELASALEKEIQTILQSEGIEKGKNYLLIDSRLKSRKSFLEKMYKLDDKGNRKYTNPNQLTDIAGARVVGYILSDVSAICPLIERHFDIDDRTLRLAERLEEDRIGYRSNNYVACVGGRSLNMTNLSQKFNGLCFEVQVKTLLDFAWQEIQHDRVYKTSAQFPSESHIRRKFNLIAGLLEVADDRFEMTTKEAGTYEKKVIDKVNAGELDDLEISPYSLRLYLQDFKDVPGMIPYFQVTDQVIEEIRNVGITRISQLDKIIPSDFKTRYTNVSKPEDRVTYAAMLRDILIIHDAQQYTRYAYRPHYYDTFDYHAYKVHKEFGVNFDHLPPGVDYDEGDE